MDQRALDRSADAYIRESSVRCDRLAAVGIRAPISLFMEREKDGGVFGVPRLPRSRARVPKEQPDAPRLCYFSKRGLTLLR